MYYCNARCDESYLRVPYHGRPLIFRLTEMNESMAKLQSSLAVCYGATMMSWMLAFVSAGCGYPAFFFPITHMLKCTVSESVLRLPL